MKSKNFAIYLKNWFSLYNYYLNEAKNLILRQFSKKRSNNYQNEIIWNFYSLRCKGI